MSMAAAVKRADVVPQLRTDDREVPQRGLNQALTKLSVVLQEEPQRAGEHQHQREQQHEAVVGHQGGQVWSAVVEELVRHRQGSTEPTVLTLISIKSFDGAHTTDLTSRP